MRVDPKLGHSICAICCKPFACAECASMLDKTCIHDLTPQQQLLCQPVIDCTYRPFIGSFNNWNIITLSHKAETSVAFEDIYQVVLDGISDNMASLVQYGNYVSINTTDTLTMGYYVIRFFLRGIHFKRLHCMLRKKNSAVELVLNAQYLSCIQEKKIGIGSRKISNKSLLFQQELFYIHVLILCQ